VFSHRCPRQTLGSVRQTSVSFTCASVLRSVPGPGRYLSRMFHEKGLNMKSSLSNTLLTSTISHMVGATCRTRVRAPTFILLRTAFRKKRGSIEVGVGRIWGQTGGHG